MADVKDPFKEATDKRIDFRGAEHSAQVERFDRGDGKGPRQVIALQNLEGGPAIRYDFGSDEAKRLADKYPELEEFDIAEGGTDEVAQLRREIAELKAQQRAVAPAPAPVPTVQSGPAAASAAESAPAPAQPAGAGVAAGQQAQPQTTNPPGA